MTKITYKLIIKFIKVKKILNQTEIANELNVNKSHITRVINEQQALSPSIDKDRFFEKLLAPFFLNDLNLVKRLYKFLKENDVITDEIKNVYGFIDSGSEKNNVGSEKTAIRDFLKIIVEEAENNRLIERQGFEDTTNEVKFTPDNYETVEKFIGREQLIQDMLDTMKKYGLIVICGMGGLGKSQSALCYAVQGIKNRLYSQVQVVYFNKDLASTLFDISFVGFKNPSNKNEDALKTRLDIMSKLNEDALLIIDNMDVEEISDKDNEILSALSDMPLHIIITSRNTHLYAKQYLVPITPLSNEDQLKLFIAHYINDETNEENLPDNTLDGCKKILQMVCGHTMLIELIAKTMRDYSMSPGKMIKALSEGRGIEDFTIDVEKDKKYKQEDIYNTVSTLFDISNIKNSEKDILMKLALASVSGVRMAFFDDFLLDGLSRTKIASLIHRSWIIRDLHKLPENNRIRLHPLIAGTVIRNNKLNLNDLRPFVESAIKAYSMKNDDIMVVDRRDVCSILIKVGEMFKDEYNYKYIDLLIQQVELIYKASHFTEAYHQCSLALQICKNDEKHCQGLLPTVYRLQADVAVRTAKYEEAIDFYNKAIEMWEKEEKPPYENIAKAYTSLANVYRKNSNYTKALDNFRSAENRMDVNGVDNIELKADIFNNIGIVYINLDKLDMALEYYKKGKDIREHQQTIDKIKLAYSYHNIGTVYQKQHKMNEAIEWHGKALALREEICDPKDPVFADSYTMLGNDYAELSNTTDEKHFEKAYNYIIKGLKLREEALGLEHPAVAWSYQSLGKNYFYQEKYIEARDSFRKCLAIRKKSLNSDHAYIGEALVWLGKASQKCGEIDDAIECYQRACTIQGISKPEAQKETTKLIKSLKKKPTK